MFKYIKSGYRYKAYLAPNEIGDIEKWQRWKGYISKTNYIFI